MVTLGIHADKDIHIDLGSPQLMTKTKPMASCRRMGESEVLPHVCSGRVLKVRLTAMEKGWSYLIGEEAFRQLYK